MWSEPRSLSIPPFICRSHARSTRPEPGGHRLRDGARDRRLHTVGEHLRRVRIPAGAGSSCEDRSPSAHSRPTDRGGKDGVPALVLIREPEGAILSPSSFREPDVALRDALVAYARFYACLLPYRRSFVVADFGEVTRDLGAVIRRSTSGSGRPSRSSSTPKRTCRSAST